MSDRRSVFEKMKNLEHRMCRLKEAQANAAAGFAFGLFDRSIHQYVEVDLVELSSSAKDEIRQLIGVAMMRTSADMKTAAKEYVEKA